MIFLIFFWSISIEKVAEQIHCQTGQPGFRYSLHCLAATAAPPLMSGLRIVNFCFAMEPQLQPLVVHGKAFLNIFMKPLRCPVPETNCHIRLNTIADCDNYIEIVMGYISLTFFYMHHCIFSVSFCRSRCSP